MDSLKPLEETITSAHTALTTLIQTTAASTQTRSSARAQLRLLKTIRFRLKRKETQIEQLLLDTLAHSLRVRAKHARKA